MGLPDTGASMIVALRLATSGARVRTASGLTVLISTQVEPVLRPAVIPSAPCATAFSAAVSVTIVKTASPASAAARGVSAKRMPLSISHCAFARVRL